MEKLSKEEIELVRSSSSTHHFYPALGVLVFGCLMAALANFVQFTLILVEWPLYAIFWQLMFFSIYLTQAKHGNIAALFMSIAVSVSLVFVIIEVTPIGAAFSYCVSLILILPIGMYLFNKIGSEKWWKRPIVMALFYAVVFPLSLFAIGVLFNFIDTSTSFDTLLQWVIPEVLVGVTVSVFMPLLFKMFTKDVLQSAE